MGKKRKSLSNRLAKMSEEARQRYLQQKADQEEETRRRKEQLINTFLKKKIKHEDAFGRLNIAKLNENWHQILRKIKCQDLKAEVQSMKEAVDRVISFKNRTIQLLLTELQEAEEQYMNNFQSHLNYIDKIIDFSKTALTDLHDEYETQLITLLKESSTERQTCHQEAKSQEVHAKTLLYEFEQKSKKEFRQNYDHYFKITDEVIQQNKNEFEEMRNAKEKQMTTLWTNIGRYLKQYVEEADIHRAHIAELSSLDTQNRQEMENNEKQLALKQAQLDKLEKKLENYQCERQCEINKLVATIATLKNEHLEQKNATHKSLQDHEKALQYLCSTSNSVINHLQKHFNQAEKLLQLSLLCRKFETKEEHATRFSTFTDDEMLQGLQEGPEDECDALAVPLISTTESALDAAGIGVEKMHNFWSFYGKIAIKLMSMKQQRAGLQREQCELKEKLNIAMEQNVNDLLDQQVERKTRAIAKNSFVSFTSAISLRIN